MAACMFFFLTVQIFLFRHGFASCNFSFSLHVRFTAHAFSSLAFINVVFFGFRCMLLTARNLVFGVIHRYAQNVWMCGMALPVPPSALHSFLSLCGMALPALSVLCLLAKCVAEKKIKRMNTQMSQSMFVKKLCIKWPQN